MIAKAVARNIKSFPSWINCCYRKRMLRSDILKARGRISNASFSVSRESILSFGTGVVLQNCAISISEGTLMLGDNVIIGHDDPGRIVHISINHGHIKIENHSRIRADIKVRFGGKVRIGKYTAINEGSEIRCDNAITIGSFCMISYGCRIYDTNAHCILPRSERRAWTMKDYPYIGAEYSRPRTSEVVVGDDVWIGVDSMILKGVRIGNQCIIGAKALVARPGSYKDCSLIASPPASVIKPIQYDSYSGKDLINDE